MIRHTVHYMRWFGYSMSVDQLNYSKVGDLGVCQRCTCSLHKIIQLQAN